MSTRDHTGIELSRRQFLQVAGAVVVTFALQPSTFAQVAIPAEKRTLYQGLDSWLAVGADGNVTVYCGKVELGTGVTTALSQIVAEELDVGFSRVRMVMGDTARVPDQGVTAGSKTIALGAPELRKAAAEARAVLLGLAADKLGVPVEALTVNDGVVGARGDAAKRATYTELIGGRRFERKITGTVKPKAVADYTIVGKPVPRVDLPAKVFGVFEYVHNVRLPGMWHGRVVRPAAIGARLRRVDENSVPQGVRVVARGDFVGVVAEREEIAIAAARALKVEWDMPANAGEKYDLHAAMRGYQSETQQIAANGDVERALPTMPRTLKATYLTPFQSHGSIGPSCGVAEIRDGKLTLWSGTQHSFGLATAVAKVLGMAPDNVRVVWVEASGCYGHNGADDVAVDAALLAQATGKSVRVQWMRHDEHGWDPKGTAMAFDLAAGLDAEGRIAAWDFINLSATHSTRPVHQPGNTLGGQLTGHPLAYTLSNAGRNADVTYAIPVKRVRIRYHTASPLRPSALRGLSAYQNTFANESFVDELAAAAQSDPVAFRLKHLKNERAAAVISAAARLANWQPRAVAGPRTKEARAAGRGIAFCQYENDAAYAAVVAEVEVDRASGRVRVTALYAAHDCGLIINPDGVRNQVEGCLIQGMSRALLEEVLLNRGGVTSLDWAGYPITRFEDIPARLEVELINRPDQPSVGAGEGATCPLAAAIANAIYDATGARLRQYPFTPGRVKEILASA